MIDVAPLGRGARIGLLIGPVLSMLDSSIVNVAVPTISSDLHATVDEVQWVVSGYLLSLALSLAATAYLSRRYGALRVYAVSMIGFTAASAACALAPTVEVLTLVRVVQGLAGAPLVPLALSILLGKHGVGGGAAMPISAALTLFLAPALGPSVGGLILGSGGWRWIFLVNVPIGLVGMLLLHAMPRNIGTSADRTARFDPVGLGLLAAGLVCLVLGSAEGSTRGWDSASAWAPATVGCALLVAYSHWALHRDQPAVNLKMAVPKRSQLALILQTLCSVIAFGTIFTIPIFTQQVQGYSALATGLALVPQGIVMGIGTYVGQKLSAFVSLRTLVVTGFVVLALTSAYLIVLDAQVPLWAISTLLAGRAIAIGFITMPLLTALLAPLPDDELADGNTLFNITQRIGGAVGISALASLIGGDSTAQLVGSFHTLGIVLTVTATIGATLAIALGPSDTNARKSGRVLMGTTGK